MSRDGRFIGRLGQAAKGNLSARQIASRATVLFLVLASLLSFGVYAWHVVRWSGNPFPGFLLNYRSVVGYTSRYDWTGSRAGLKYPDRIVEVNGKAVTSVRVVEEEVRRAEVGTPVEYTVERKGKRFTVRIPTMRFTLPDLLLTCGVTLLEGILFLALGALVFVLKPDAPVSRVFFAGCLINSVSTFVGNDLETTHLGLQGVIFACSLYLPAAGFHLALLFPEKSKWLERRPYLPAIPYGLSTVVLIPVVAFYPHPAVLRIYPFVLLYLVAAAFFFIASCVGAYRGKLSPLSRQRAKLVLLGAGAAFPLPVIAPFLASMGMTVAGVKIPTNYAHLTTVLFPLSIAYAIARHNLFDVDVFIKRTVGYAIMTVVVGAAYFSLQVGLEALVLAPVLGETAHKVTPVLFAFLVVFLFHPLNRRVQEVVDRMFYRKTFDYKATVTAVSDALSSVLNLDEIVRKIVGTVHSEMFIDRSGLILTGMTARGYPAYFMADAPSGGAEEIRSTAIPAGDPLVGLVQERKRLVTKYDVAEDPHFADVREACGKRFEELEATLAVPLLYQNEVKAVLAVGQKKSGHFFTREDVELLQALASHGAVAIENANLAEQMKKEETVRTNLSRYLSPQIVEKIVQHDVQVNLGGDRKVVTVLFSDIRNFTTITETRPPDQLVHILNEYFTEMAKIIFEHQGSLDKYIGDAIVAVFGSLIPLENPAKNAVAAAVAMMKRLPDLNRRWEARYDFYMNIGIGVNTGEVFLGNIGSPERMEFTVIGDAVNVASRFSGLAKPGQVLLTKETLAKLGTDFQVREHPPAEVKGKTGKLEVFEVLYS